VALSAGVVLAVFIAAAAFALDQAFRDSARSAREERLLAQVYLLMSAAEVDSHGAMSISSGPLEPRFEMPQSGLYATITNAQGKVVWRSTSALNVDVPYGKQIPAGVHTFEQVKDGAGHGYFLQSFGVSWATAGRNFPFTFSVT
jgi:two-component system sensor histidine kinase PhoQ